MSYITRFGGYTPEDDLASSDWTLRFDADATGTVRGIWIDYVGADSDDSNAAAYGFSQTAANGIGTYIICVYGQGNANGIAYVEVDGMVADPVVEYSANNENHGIYIVTAASMLDGDVHVEFNVAVNGCAIAVYQAFGIEAPPADDTVGDAFETYQAIDVNTLTAIVGTGGYYVAADWIATGHYWYGLTKDVETDIDSTQKHSAASVRKVFTDTTISVGVEPAVTPATSHWLAAAWDSPCTYFPHGQGVLFEKQVADDYTIWSWDQVTRVDDVEVLALVRPTVQSDTFRCGVIARAAGSDGAAEGYAFVLSQSGAGAQDTVSLLNLVAGAESTLAAPAFAWALDTNYWLKLRISGSRIRARVWAQSGSEPTTWNIDVTDTSVSDAGYVGIFHQYIDSAFEVGHFEAKILYDEWPSGVPMNWSVDMGGGPQSNKIAFMPDVGPTIERRRASVVNRAYNVTLPGLDQDEYLAFVEFYHTTLEEGTLPFMTTDPFTGEEKTFRFISKEMGYQETLMRPVGPDYDEGLYQIEFAILRLD